MQKAINNPVWEFECDLCGKKDQQQWLPPNWEALSIALSSGGMGQFHICQECITTSAIIVLTNRAKTNMRKQVDSDNIDGYDEGLPE